MISLKYVGYALIKMVCASVHNYIVARIVKFSFEIEIPNTYEDDLISEFVIELIEFENIFLISHREYLHLVGEV